MSSGVFEHLAAFDESAQIASRKAVAVAHKRVEDYIGPFVRNAASAADVEARLALVEDDVDQIVADTVEEYGGNAKHIKASIREHLADAEHLKEYQFKKKDESDDDEDDSDGGSSNKSGPDGEGDGGETTSSVRQGEPPLRTADYEIGGDPGYGEQRAVDESAGPTNTFPCAGCGTEMHRFRGQGDQTCPNCGQEHNGFGQALAPRSQWGEETGEIPSDIYGPDPESVGYPYEAKTSSPESINVEPNWDNMRAWVLNMAQTDPQKAQEIAQAMGREAPPELLGPGGPAGQEMGNPYPHDEPSPGLEMGGEAGPYQASTREARRPKMCPYHSELVDASLQSGEPQYASFSNLVGGPSHCRGGFEGSCNFKPEMVTQSYWDKKQDEYAERRDLREQERQHPQPIEPIPAPGEPTPELSEGEGITDLNGELAEAPSAVGNPELEPAMASRVADADRDGGGAVKTEKLPKADDDALGGPSPKIKKGPWQNEDGSSKLEPVDAEMDGSPVPTKNVDIGKPIPADRSDDFLDGTDSVTEQQDLPSADEDGQSTERNVSQEGQSDTWSGLEGQADPVTSAVDPDKNPLREILQQEQQVEAAIRNWEAQNKE